MTWIPLSCGRTVAFSSAVAIKLYQPDSKHMVLSLEAWRVRGEPVAVKVLFDPGRGAVALVPMAALADDYKVHALDNHQCGHVDCVQVNAANKLRKLARQFGYAWPEYTVSLDLTQEGEKWVALLPVPAQEED